MAANTGRIRERGKIEVARQGGLAGRGGWMEGFCCWDRVEKREGEERSGQAGWVGCAWWLAAGEIERLAGSREERGWTGRRIEREGGREGERMGHGCKHRSEKRDGIYLQGAMAAVHNEAPVDEGEARTGV
ncbi:hypothetical protein AAC387_Pa03g2048 [Persea americana]